MAWVLVNEYDGFAGAATAVGAAGSNTGVPDRVDRLGNSWNRNGAGRARCVSGGAARVLTAPDGELFRDTRSVIRVTGNETITTFHAVLGWVGGAPNRFHFASQTGSQGIIRRGQETGGSLTTVDLVAVGFAWNTAKDWEIDFSRRLSAGVMALSATFTNRTDGASIQATATDSTAELLGAGAGGFSANGNNSLFSYHAYYKWVELAASPAVIRVGEEADVVVTGENVDFQTPGTPLALAGGTGASIVSQDPDPDAPQTVKHLRIQAGTAVGPLTITDPVTGGTCTVQVVEPYFTCDPVQILPGSVGNEVLITAAALGSQPWDALANLPVIVIESGPAGAFIAFQEILSPNTARLRIDSPGLQELDLVLRDPVSGATGTLGVNRTILPGNPLWVHSPGVWEKDPAGTWVMTCFGGAYGDLDFSGTSGALLVDTTRQASLAAGNYPYVAWQLDDEPIVHSQLTPGQTELSIGAGLPNTRHRLHYWFEHGNVDVDTWEIPASSLRLTGFRVDAGGLAYAPAVGAEKTLGYGDSILYGRKQRGTSNLITNHTPWTSWFALLARAFGLEYGQRGHPGAKFTGGGQGGTPAFHQVGNPLQQSWRWFRAGVDATAELAALVLKHVIVAYGRNDGASGVTDAAIAASVVDLLISYRVYQPHVQIYFVLPFSGQGADGIRLGVALYLAEFPEDTAVAILTPDEAARLGLLQENGVDQPTVKSVDGVHPDSPAHALFAAQLALQLIAAVRTRWVSVLDRMQRGLYRHRVAIWRATAGSDADGEAGGQTWSVLAEEVPCYFQVRDSLHAPAGFALAESENLLTTDLVHFHASVDVDSGDVLEQVEGPDAGEFWAVRGNPKRKTLLANKLSVQATRLEAPPWGAE